MEKVEVEVEAERGSACPHLNLSLSLDLSLLAAILRECSPVVPRVRTIEVLVCLEFFRNLLDKRTRKFSLFIPECLDLIC